MVEGFLVGRYGNHHSWMIEIIMIRCQVLLWLYTFYFCFTVYLVCTSLVANLALSGGPDLGGWRESRQWQDGSRPARSRFPANKIFIFLWNPGAGDSCRRLWQDASSSDGTLHRRQYRKNGCQGLNECFYHTSGAVLYICDWWLNVHCTLYSHYN